MQDQRETWSKDGARPKTHTASRSDEDITEEVRKHMPPDLRNGEFHDILIIHGQKDLKKLEHLPDFMEKISAVDDEVKVALFNKDDSWLMARPYDHYITEEAINRCTLIFLFVDEHFIKEWVKISSTMPLRNLLYETDKKCRLIPIQAISPEKLENRKLPMPLDSLTPLNYYRNDDLYRSNLRQIIAKNKHKRKNAEQIHERRQDEWLKNNFQRITEEGTSRRQLCQNTPDIVTERDGKVSFNEKVSNVMIGDNNTVININYSENCQEENKGSGNSQSYQGFSGVRQSVSTETGYDSGEFTDNGDVSRDFGAHSIVMNEDPLRTPDTPLVSMEASKPRAAQDVYNHRGAKPMSQRLWTNGPSRKTNVYRAGDQNDGFRDNRSEDKQNKLNREKNELCSRRMQRNRGRSDDDNMTSNHASNIDWSILDNSRKDNFSERKFQLLSNPSPTVCHVQGVKSGSDNQKSMNAKNIQDDDEKETALKIPISSNEESHSIAVKEIDETVKSMNAKNIQDDIEEETALKIPISSNEESHSTAVKEIDETVANSLTGNSTMSSRSGAQGGVRVSLMPHFFDPDFQSTHSNSGSAGSIPISSNVDSSFLQSAPNSNEYSSNIEQSCQTRSYRSNGDLGHPTSLTNNSGPQQIDFNFDNILSLSSSQLRTDEVSFSPVCNITQMPLTGTNQKYTQQQNIRRKPTALVSPMWKD